MYFLNLPEDDLGDFFEDLLKGRHNNNKNSMLITRLQSVKKLLIDAENNYQILAGERLLHTITEVEEIIIPDDIEIDEGIPRVISDKEMEKVYTNFLVDKPDSDKVGRVIYNKILSNTYYNLCPYCSQREVKTIDHYLPKSKFINLAITPINLLPCCSDCNKSKLDNYTLLEDQMIIHPYFEDLSNEEWLGCKVVENVWPITFSYYILEVNDPIFYSRLNYQFDLFELWKLYADNASREFNNRLKSLIREYNSNPDNKALEFINDNLESYRSENKNSWQTKMFDSLSKSSWFFEEALPRLHIYYKK